MDLLPWPGGLTRSHISSKHEVALRRRTNLFKRVARLTGKERHTLEAHFEILMERRCRGKTISAISNALEELEKLGNTASSTQPITHNDKSEKKDEGEDEED